MDISSNAIGRVIKIIKGYIYYLVPLYYICHDLNVVMSMQSLQLD